MVCRFVLGFFAGGGAGRREGRGEDSAKNVVVTLEDVELLLTSLSDKHLLNSSDTSSQTHRNRSTYVLNTDFGKYSSRLEKWGLALTLMHWTVDIRKQAGYLKLKRY